MDITPHPPLEEQPKKYPEGLATAEHVHALVRTAIDKVEQLGMPWGDEAGRVFMTCTFDLEQLGLAVPNAVATLYYPRAINVTIPMVNNPSLVACELTKTVLGSDGEPHSDAIKVLFTDGQYSLLHEYDGKPANPYGTDAGYSRALVKAREVAAYNDILKAANHKTVLFSGNERQ